ncbi:hypothetical protein NLO413_0109 [Candidatus Neoehrlichia lotoris str. RAC413]|uniref:Uncharacterized protein n=1 Tax=Candidatus Neoehrlichia procyonis str. RAC413 TaxID=1359163 RepID=A0A0F3NLU8_9RICK|nr:hypothetical protein NLO413_0109 [Candidatus Neoehrlichia lotoris str. RAC413]
MAKLYYYRLLFCERLFVCLHLCFDCVMLTIVLCGILALVTFIFPNLLYSLRNLC